MIIKSPSLQSNNKSLDNIVNYKEKYEETITTYSTGYIKIIKYFVKLTCESPEINDLKYFEFICQRGVECLAHIYNILLLYTKNLELTNYYCCKASHYFIEFVSQIGNESHSFLQLNTKDAILFVYKKTIFDINNEYRKNFVMTDKEQVIINSVKKETEVINIILVFFLDSIIYKNINSYITTCLKKKNNILTNIDCRKINNNKYSNYLKSIITLLDHLKYIDLPLKYSETIINAFIKKNIKANIHPDILNVKLKENDINELYTNMSVTKLVNLLIE